MTGFWLEKGRGRSVDNALMGDVEQAIEEILKKDQGKDIFWIGHAQRECVLEIHKSLIFFFIYGENQDRRLKVQLDNWDVLRSFAKRYFDKDFLGLKNEIKLKSFLDTFKITIQSNN